MFFVIFVNMRFIVIFLFFFPVMAWSQHYFRNHFGGSVGLVLNFGTHVNATGINLKGYYTDYFYQLNAGSTVRFSFSSYGNRRMYWENRNAIGIVLLGGKRETEQNFILDGLHHQTNYNLGVGYNYIWYFDNAGTSQCSGGFGVHVKAFSLLLENDVFAGQGRDRYRTGHVHTSYRYGDLRFAVGANMWTGETRGSRIEVIPVNNHVHGFKFLEDLPYGRTSHGILYGGIDYRLPYGQTASVQLGIDSEHVRHVLQNKLIHDVIFLPKRWIKKSTPHYPCLDNEGCPTFEKTDYRKTRLFFQIGTNENWSD